MNHLFIRFCLLLWLLVLSGYAFSGKVVDSTRSEPIAGALIYLENAGIVDTTDDDGFFSYGEARIKYNKNIQNAKPEITANSIHLFGSGLAKLEIFDIRGRVVVRVIKPAGITKTFVFDLSLITLPGFYIVRMQHEGAINVFRLLHSGQNAWSIRQVWGSVAGRGGQSGEGEGETFDTLTIVADGYVGKFVEVEHNDTTLEVKMPQVEEGPWLGSMVRIPGGTFIIGDSAGNYDEKNSHTVSISAFFIDTTEVTQEEYIRVMGMNPSMYTGDLKRPVERVSWYDAVRYCIQRSNLEGRVNCYDTLTWGCDLANDGYRLPTEAEWEYACRAGTTTPFFWGDSEPEVTDYGWVSSNSESITHIIAQKKKNGFGLYDMIGNVGEWCTDFWALYNSMHQIDPVMLDETKSTAFPSRIARGISYADGTSRMDGNKYIYNSSYRLSVTPTAEASQIGFRVVSRSDVMPVITYLVLPTSTSGGAIYPAKPVSVVRDSSQKFIICTYSAAILDSVTWGTEKLTIDYSEDTSVTVSDIHRNDTVKAWFSHPEVVEGEHDEGMVLLPSGVVIMGDQTGRGSANERPIQSFDVASFYIDTTEITKENYMQLTGIELNSHSEYDTSDNLPVECTWHDALLYCNKRSNSEGLDTVYSYVIIEFPGMNDPPFKDVLIDSSKNGYRLPFEFEWEYACKAGTTTDFFWGNCWTDSIADLFMTYHRSGQTSLTIAPVAIRRKNGFGLYDMSGNVSEWCNDIPLSDPEWPISLENYRVIRGGDYRSELKNCRSSSRTYEKSQRHGFRTVRKP